MSRISNWSVAGALMLLGACGPLGSPEGDAVVAKLESARSPVLAKEVLGLPDLRFVCVLLPDGEPAQIGVDTIRAQFDEPLPDSKLGRLRDGEIGVYAVTGTGEVLIPIRPDGGLNEFGDDCVRGQTALFVADENGWWLRGDQGPHFPKSKFLPPSKRKEAESQ